MARKEQSRMNRMSFFRIKICDITTYIFYEVEGTVRGLSLNFKNSTLSTRSTVSGCHYKSSPGSLQYLQEQTAWQVRDAYIQIFLGEVCGAVPFSSGVLPTIFSCTGIALCICVCSRDALKIAAPKNSK